MTASPSFRPLLAIVVGAALLSQSGCVWLRTKFANTAVYEDSEQSHPLEMPPDLDVPNTSSGVAIPDVTPNPMTQGAPVSSAPGSSAPQSAPVAPSAPMDGFMLADTAEGAFRRIGVALTKIEGVVVGVGSPELGTHSVTFQGTPMLIRVEGSGDSTRVSAVGPDGARLSGGAAGQLLALLKARLG